MPITRRDFLKHCGAGTLGIALSQFYLPEVLKIFEAAAAGEPPVLWLQGQSCTGCSVSLLNTVHPSIADVLLKVISVKFHPTVMAAQGDLAISAIEKTYKENAGKYILIVEGSIPIKDGGIHCTVGETHDGKPITILDWAKKLAPKAAAIVAVGTCAAYGGIPGGAPNPTGAKSVKEVTGKTVLNLPGCPAHPDWIVGSLVHVLRFGLPALDEHGRPKMFYGKNIHENCQNYFHYNNDTYAENLSDEGCLINLGCKGPQTYADCPKRHWNNGVNWCIGAKAPCIGCTQPEFPDGTSPMYAAIQDELRPKKVKINSLENTLVG
ncbi:MAG: hydrogenase small subunit [bacterium]|nr:hydrogenase small subunit [bacterium]